MGKDEIALLLPLLQSLRNGDAVQLGEFSNQAQDANEADLQAAAIDGLIFTLERGK